jgi:release factor glutamine methyltransferase
MIFLKNNMRHVITILVNDIAKKLVPVYKDESASYSQAWRILEHLTGYNKSALFLKKEIEIDDAALALILNQMIMVHKPLDYIIGSIQFLDVVLDVQSPVLIPRPETEWWCSLLIQTIEPFVTLATADKPFMVLDMCTGSGALALAIAHHFKNRALKVHAVDNAAYALELAQHNAQKNHITNCGFINSDLFKNVPDYQQYDIIVTNPPYISPEDYTTLDPSVRDWEDKSALVADHEGYYFIERIVESAPRFLRNVYGYGQLWCEIGATQAPRVVELFKHSRFTDIEVLQDLSERPRVVHGTLYKVLFRKNQ